KLIEPLRAGSRFFFQLVEKVSSPIYGLNCRMKSDLPSSACRTFCTCFWKAVSCGICAYIDLRPGTPQPLFARSCAGLPPMYCSNTAHAASASLVWAEMTQPVAVIVGSRRTPDHVGAGRKTVLPFVLSLSAIALYQ